LSILTKALTVLVTVLAVGLVAVVVPLIASQDNYRVALTEKTDEARELRARLTQVLKEREEDRLAADKARAALSEQITDLSAQYSSQLQRTADAEAGRRAALRLVEGLDAKIADLVLLRGADQKLIAQHAEDAKEARSLLVEVQRSDIEKAQQVVDLATDLARAQDTARGLQQQVQLYREQYDEKAAQLAAAMELLPEDQADDILLGQDPTALAVRSGAGTVSGRVTAVRQVGSDPGVTMLQIDVGSQDGVVKRSEFFIYRGTDEYLGMMTVRQVDERTAYGEVTEMAPGKEVRVNDYVYIGPRE